MASLQDSHSPKGPLLADVLRERRGLIEQLASCLDREMRLVPNWKHLSTELKVDAKVITGLEQYIDISPTIRLFEYLERARPDLTIQQLKQALLEIRRNDLFSLLTTTAGFIDSELVSEVITSRSTEVPSPRVGVLDEIALALDVNSKGLANWRCLALALGVLRNIFKQFERRSVQSPTSQLFEYLASIRPKMTLKPLKEALAKMTRNDLLKPLLNLEDEAVLKDVMAPDSELLQKLADELDMDHVSWAPNWRKLAFYLDIPSDVYLGFCDTTAQRKSPTKKVLEWLVVRKPDLLLFDIVEALEKIQRNDAIQIITQQFSETVDCSLERLGVSWNSNFSFDFVPNTETPTAKSLFTPSYKRDDFTRGSFLKQEDLKQPGHCGNLPDGNYVLKGREDACEQIIKSLMSNKAVEVVAPPGYGKTSVVVQTAHRLIKKHGKFVAYVNPRGVTCVEDLGCRIIEALGEDPGENTIRETLHRIRSLKAKNVVLIIENLDNLLHLENNQELEPDQECCSKMRGKYKKDDFITFVKEIGQSETIYLIITSTENNDFSVSFPIELIQLNPLSDEDSFNLFKEREKSLDEETIKGLVRICGGIPMVICTVLSLLKTSNPQKLCRRLSIATPTELIKQLSPEDLPHEDRIDLCLKECFRRLSENDQEVLVMLSTFPHRFIQEQFYSVFQSRTDLDLETCMNSLKHTSLLRFERESCYYCIHPFIRKFCSVHSPDKHKEAKSIFIRHYSDLVVTLSKKFLTPDSKSAVEQFRVEKENIKEATAWCEDEHPDTDQDVREYCIDAFNKAAVFLAKVLRKQEFESLFCKLSHQCRYDLQRHSACLTVIGTKIILSCTCTPHICSRAWYRAISVLSRANEIQSNLKTVDDATRAQCLSKLGFCYVREGRVSDGFEYLNQALTLRRIRYEQSTKNKDQVMFAACHNDLAASMMLQRKHMVAIETRRKIVLPVYESTLGNDHPFVATTLSWIAKSYHELGEYDNAVKYATQALQIRETRLGRHQETARSYYDVGVALSAKKDHEGALEHLEHAVELQEEVLDTYEELVLTHQAIAVVLMELGRDEEAEREMGRAGECAKKLDSLEVPLQTLMTHEENGWQKTDPVTIGSTSKEHFNTSCTMV